MSRIQFGEGACGKVRTYMDSYISNELMVETNHEVANHIEACPACTAELDVRTRLRARVKAAVNSQTVPPELQVKIRQQIRGRSARNWFSFTWTGWAVAGAAGLAACGALWLTLAPEHLPALNDRPGQGVYIRKVSANLAAVLQIGLGDHIHCSIFRKYPQNPPPVEKMTADLGPEYQGLLPIVKDAIPDGYRVIMAHKCGFNGRRFVHVTLENHGELMSLVIARKNPGESLEGLSKSSERSGVAIYQSTAGRYEIAGFDAGNFLAYVVSDLRGKTNLELARDLAPGVREFLLKVTA